MLIKLPRLLLLPLLLAAAIPCLAKSHEKGNDRASFGSDIVVAEGETMDDVACAFCSVHVKGTVNGDVAVFWGSVDVEPEQSIRGDVAMAAGDIHLGEGATINGDVAILGGTAHLANGAEIHGGKSYVPKELGLLILFSPFLFLGLLIWLIVYLVRRSRYRFPVYPHGQGVPPPPPPLR